MTNKAIQTTKRERLKLKGQMAFREQLTNAGGAYSLHDVSKLLGISVPAVRKRVERKTLLAVSFSGLLQYPVWQFSDTEVIPGFTKILSLLENTTSVSTVQFFLTYDEDLKTTPIEAIKNSLEDKSETIRILAKQWQQQVAR